MLIIEILENIFKKKKCIKITFYPATYIEPLLIFYQYFFLCADVFFKIIPLNIMIFSLNIVNVF